MFDSDFWGEIWQTISRCKGRSIMTAFGVFWGIFMLVLLVGAGMGLNNGLIGNIKDLPTNSFLLVPGETSIASHGFSRGRIWQMDNNDTKAIEAKLANKTQSVASVKFASSDKLLVTSNNSEGDFTVAGVTPSYYKAMPHKLIEGRYINDIDITEERKVCVIGIHVAEQLFPSFDSYVNQQIVLDKVPYTVVGVCKNPNRAIDIGVDPGKSVLLPITTVQLAYNAVGKVDISVVILKDQYPASEYCGQVASLVKERHFIAEEDATALNVTDLSQHLNQYYNLFKGIEILIWLVGLGTLLAGLIGISNIMMVTINERTHEIGVRRALGALPEVIIKQIIFESLTLTMSAGFLGLCSGVGLLTFINTMMSKQMEDAAMFQNPYMPFWAAIAAFSVLVLGGLFAGWVPAKRALKIKAIEALREE